MAQKVVNHQSEDLMVGASETHADHLSCKKKSTRLTSRQRHVHDVLVNFINKNGYPPSRQELSSMLQLKSPNAAEDHLKALQKKGYISLVRGKSRGIILLNQSEQPHLKQLVQELVDNVPGARERALDYLRDEGIR